MDGYLSIREVAARLGVKPNAVRRWITKGALKAYRLGGHLLRVKVEDADAMLRPLEPRP